MSSLVANSPKINPVDCSTRTNTTVGNIANIMHTTTSSETEVLHVTCALIKADVKPRGSAMAQAIIDYCLPEAVGPNYYLLITLIIVAS